MRNWSQLVAALAPLQERAATLRAESWRSAPPNPPATDADISAAEQRLGVLFDDAYRDLLRTCDGWPVFGNSQLYGTHDLGVSDDWAINKDAIEEYFASQGRDATTAPEGHRFVLIAHDNSSSRFVVAAFPSSTREQSSRCYDCQSGEDTPFDDIYAWAQFESRAITTSLDEAIAEVAEP
ncbi:SMI1/KNR4 family protein [Nocardia sp. NBC_01499]|uniref:SMI1/KNR4 family protein n=1 Tax=Nocardia sp. NBC_01499 TaxID=2903597 RepID=UPI00386897C3